MADSTTNSTKRYAALLRVSGRRQVKEETIEIQEQSIRLWCERKGIDADNDVHWFYDKAVSGDVPLREREGGGALLAAAEAGRVTNGVIVYKINRAVREDLLGYLELEYACAENNLTLYATQDSLDTSTKSGRTMARLRAVLADDEKRELVDRLADAKRARARMGRWQTRAPYGWKLDEDKHLTLHPAQSLVVRELIRLLLVDGLSVYKIADELTAQRIPSPRGLDHWDYSVILKILRNPLLYGEGRYNTTQTVRRKGKKIRQIPRPDDEHITIDAEPLIDRATFDRIQDTIAANSRRYANDGTIIAHFWLTGLVKCGLCGRTYNPQMTRGRTNGERRFYYYRHAHHRGAGACERSGSQIPRDTLEPLVWRDLTTDATNPDKWKRRAEAEQKPIDTDEIDRAENAVRLAEAKLTDLEESYFVRGSTSAERYDAIAPKLTAALNLARRQLAEVKTRQAQTLHRADALERTAAELARLRSVIEHFDRKGTIADRRELAAAIIRRVVIIEHWRDADSQYGTPRVVFRVEYRS